MLLTFKYDQLTVQSIINTEKSTEKHKSPPANMQAQQNKTKKEKYKKTKTMTWIAFQEVLV